MEQITLFEIPIYLTSKKIYEEYIIELKQDLYNYAIEKGCTEDEANYCVEIQYSNFNLWEYNQIVGYIKISLTSHDVWFEIYNSFKQKHYKLSNKKNHIKDTHTLGLHFNIDNKENEYIKTNIKNMLKNIKKQHIRKNWYIEQSAFNNTIDYLDIEGLIKSFKNKQVKDKALGSLVDGCKLGNAELVK